MSKLFNTFNSKKRAPIPATVSRACFDETFHDTKNTYCLLYTWKICHCLSKVQPYDCKRANDFLGLRCTNQQQLVVSEKRAAAAAASNAWASSLLFCCLGLLEFLSFPSDDEVNEDMFFKEILLYQSQFSCSTAGHISRLPPYIGLKYLVAT